MMLKRLIEVALRPREVSEHSARETSIRHGHRSTPDVRRPAADKRAKTLSLANGWYPRANLPRGKT